MKKKRIISIILSLITMFSAFSAYAIQTARHLTEVYLMDGQNMTMTRV